jgi:organic radical activating enzyme
MEIKLRRVGFYVTFRCNLRCKLCASYTPYYENPWHIEASELCDHIDKLFDIASYIDRFHVTGGEPFLRDDLDTILFRTSQYAEKIGTLEIVTNGTIIPKEHIFRAMMKFNEKLRIIVNDYGSDTSTLAKELLSEINHRLPNAHAKTMDYTTSSLSGWVDYDMRHKERTESETQKIFDNCHLHKKIEWDFSMVNGTLYPCPQTKRAIELNLISANPIEAIDILDIDCSIDSIKKRITSRFSLCVLSACKYFEGQCDSSNWHKPAEQLISKIS